MPRSKTRFLEEGGWWIRKEREGIVLRMVLSIVVAQKKCSGRVRWQAWRAERRT